MSTSRTKLIAALVAAASALLLVGCAATGTTAAAADAATSTTLKMALFDDIATPDPDTAYIGQELNLVDNAYQGLVGYKPGTAKTIVGVLASSWTEQNDTVFTFTLRKGVTFHDGTAFTSADIKSSFDRRTAVDGGPAYMVADVASVATPDPYTAVITLKAPNTAFIPLLASPFSPKMISAKALAAHPGKSGQGWFATHDAGTGPYEYGAFQKGVSYRLKAYPKYWGAKPAYTTVDFSVVTSMSTLQLELESGQVDGTTAELDKTSFATLSHQKSLKLTSWTSMETPTLFVNPKSAVLPDAATRNQLLSGIDTSRLVSNAMGGLGENTSQVFPAGMFDPSVDASTVKHSPSALSSLATGALKGKTVRIAYPGNSATSKALSGNIAAQLNAAGIKAQSTGYPQGTYYTVMADAAKAPDLTVFDGFPDTGAPSAWAGVFYSPNGGLDLYGAGVPGMDDLIAQGNQSESTEPWSKVADLVNQSGLWYSLATEKGTAVLSTSVAGVSSAYAPVITGLLDYSRLRPAR